MNSSNTKEHGYVDAKTVMGFLSIGQSTLYGMVARHEIPFYRIGRSIRFNLKEVSEYMQSTNRIEPDIL